MRRAAEILGLEEFLERKPKALSGGQRQRRDGAAIVREPQAFLMDEPLSNLDAKLRVQMRAEVSKLQDDLGTTTIYVTHDQIEAMTMGDRVAVLKKGELQQVDTPKALYDRPGNLFVAGFIGSPSMNMVEADLAAGRRPVRRLRNDQARVDDQMVIDRPGIQWYEGRRVIIGIRPENMEDAAIMPVILADRRMKVDIVLREALGSEVLVHFTVDAPPVLTEDTKELVGEQSGPMAHASVGVQELEKAAATGTPTFVARLDPRTRAAERATIELAIDTARYPLLRSRAWLGIYDES